MLLEGKRILVFGLFNMDSLAWAIGERARKEGAQVFYTAINRRVRDSILRRSLRQHGLDVNNYSVYPCDVTNEEDIAALFAELEPPLDGLVYSVAYAKPDTCLSGRLFDAPADDAMEALKISAVGLSLIVKEAAKKHLQSGSSIVAMTFESQQTFVHYNWMGVCKNTLEGIVRGLALDLGPAGIRANCLSAGPQQTTASAHIPEFGRIIDIWNERSPLGWDVSDKTPVADATVFLLSPMSRGITAATIYVDGGVHATAVPR